MKIVFTKRINQNIAGNYYDKHHSKNPLIKLIMDKFHSDLYQIIYRINPKNLLDIGCGEGYTTGLIKKKFKNIKINGSDIDKKIIGIAKKNNPKIKFSEESIYKLKSKNEKYDLVLATEVLEHLKYPRKAVNECKRISKNYCVFSVPYEPFWRMANIIRLAYLKDLGDTPGHIQHWTKGQFKKMLKRNFSSVRVFQSTLWNIALCKK